MQSISDLVGLSVGASGNLLSCSIQKRKGFGRGPIYRAPYSRHLTLYKHIFNKTRGRPCRLPKRIPVSQKAAGFARADLAKGGSDMLRVFSAHLRRCHRQLCRLRRSQRGATAVEFALIAPVFLATLIA